MVFQLFGKLYQSFFPVCPDVVLARFYALSSVRLFCFKLLCLLINFSKPIFLSAISMESSALRFSSLLYLIVEDGDGIS